MKQPVVGFHQDEEGDWVARLGCGHNQHIRHNPPWQNRSWVTTEAGRQQQLGALFDCKKCETNQPADWTGDPDH